MWYHWCTDIILTEMQEKGRHVNFGPELRGTLAHDSMFSLNNLQEKGCFFCEFRKRKGMGSEVALAHPHTKIR